MALIQVTAVSINGEDLVSGPLALNIEDNAIKYVFQHKKTSAYDSANTEIIYYDQMAAKLAVVLVTETVKAVFDMYAHFLMITAQRLDGIPVTKPMLLNDNSFGYGIALSPKDDDSVSIIAYNTLVNTFQVNDIITGGTSGATARILYDSGYRTMYVHPIKGTLQSGETITGTNSPTPTAVIVSYTAALQKYYQYESGQSVARKKKDIVAVLNQLSVTYGITAVSLANNTIDISGNHHLELTLGVPFMIDGSTGNDGLYSVVSSRYTGSATRITVKQILQDATADGDVTTV